MKLDGSILWVGEPGKAKKIGTIHVFIAGWPYSKVPRLQLNFVKNSDPHDTTSLIYDPIPETLEEAVARAPAMIDQMVALVEMEQIRSNRSH